MVIKKEYKLLIVFFVLFFCGKLFSENLAVKSSNLSPETLTNLSSFTGSYFKIPAPDKIFPEVQNILKTDPFSDIYEKDEDTPWRRFEVVTLISFPPVFLIANIILRTAKMFITKDYTFNYLSELSDKENLILYGSCVSLCFVIAVNDYYSVSRAKREKGIEWSLWKKRF